MNWQSLDHFLAMGGYGLYVWGSYAVTFALLAAEILLVAKRRRNILRELRAQARAETRRT
ncbi:MAG TPA: heme exporter protein CcmD [Burkholderiales bacterium]|nr:heme exporter protein CcmD [Burkholderiales bacterium]